MDNVLDGVYLIMNMNLWSITLIAFLASTVTAYQNENQVIVLTDDDDFGALTQKYRYLLVQFYAPWCGHCKKLAPIYEQTAQELKQSQSEIKLAKVDATKNKKLANAYDVKGYPQLLYFINGKHMQFNGQRTKQGIISWLNRKIQNYTIALRNQQQYKKLKSKKGVSLVLFSNDQKKMQQFQLIARGDDFNKYFYAPKSLVGEATKVEMIRDFNSEIFFESDDFHGLTTWIQFEGRPRLLPFDQRTKSAIFSQKQVGILFVNTGQQGSEQTLQVFRQLAADGVGDILFTSISKEDRDEFKRMPSFLKVKFDRPRIILLDFANSKKYILEEEITKDSIQNFINGFRTHNLKQFEHPLRGEYKDQAVPNNEVQNQSPSSGEL